MSSKFYDEDRKISGKKNKKQYCQIPPLLLRALQKEISIRGRCVYVKWEDTEATTFARGWKMGSMKYVESHVAMNIERYTGLGLGTEVKFRALVWFVVLVLGVWYSYAGAVGEKQKDKDLIV